MTAHQTPDDLLREHGLRPTRARQLILDVLSHENRHLSPDEIVGEVGARGERLSVATLYQNLAVLTERGLLVRFSGPDGIFRYEANTGAHHHLVCDACGRMVDVEVEGPLTAITPVLNGVGPWLVTERHVEFHGTCPECRSKNPG